MAFNQFKVKLRSQVTQTVVAFDVTPETTETRNVTSPTIEPVHMPGGIHVYKGSSSRIFNINNIRLVSRTREEASKNLYRLNQLRGWAMPYFGKNNENLVGAPPDVLALSAYSLGPQDSANSWPDYFRSSTRADTPEGENQASENFLKRTRPTNIHNIPVVLQQISIPYPSDVDYIDTKELTIQDGTKIKAGVPFPTLMTIDMVLLETHSPNEFANFDLKKYRRGLLDTF
jgi:hypothetical protein